MDVTLKAKSAGDVRAMAVGAGDKAAHDRYRERFDAGEASSRLAGAAAGRRATAASFLHPTRPQDEQ